ncbi:MMPL family transporter [Nocardia sp. NPDC051981]|uniref:MMPL family transporter n=1 Tax=Nocardia sp. NPDC051981 TaxID=3155417 RepID=UPI003441CC70
MTFRSIVLALEAILLNLLATGAALGITVTVFQHGVGQAVLGFHSAGFLQVFLPMLVFAVLFGLSMDYEVFLIRRMKEAWERTHDNATAVAEGLQRTARPITAAAAIMVAVFASFLSADVMELKEIGFALAVAVAIDAVIRPPDPGPGLHAAAGPLELVAAGSAPSTEHGLQRDHDGFDDFTVDVAQPHGETRSGPWSSAAMEPQMAIAAASRICTSLRSRPVRSASSIRNWSSSSRICCACPSFTSGMVRT